MKRPASSSSRLVGSLRNAARLSRSQTGYTLIEILISTTLSLILLGAVVAMFGRVGGAVTDSRSMLEAADRLRLAAERLQMDLGGVTVTMNPPRDPANNEGYFEYIEGPVGTSAGMTASTTVAFNTDNAGQPDATVGDFDDVLMFTTRSSGRPFVGRYGANTIQSEVAEVAWFVRGRTLHRRVLLVSPAATLPTGATAYQGYYTNYDVSARWDAGAQAMVANTLGDLTRRECRFAHTGAFPYATSGIGTRWQWSVGGQSFPTLPTLNECSYSGLTNLLPTTTSTSLSSGVQLDFWTNNQSNRVADNALVGVGNTGSRAADDVILTNVIGFDVKVWDPDVAAYVDLGYSSATSPDRFSSSGRRAVDCSTTYLPIYDTWSTHYEALAGASRNGLDDGGVAGVVDDDGEKTTSPPYPYPLRGVQVKIRVFEPDSRQIREVTVVQDFLPQ